MNHGECITTVLKAFKMWILIICFTAVLLDKKKIQSEACNNFFDYCDSIGNDDFSHDNLNFSSNILSMATESNMSLTLNREDRYKRSQNRTSDALETSNKITSMLDELLNDSGYDKQLRPGLSGNPIEVSRARFV